MSIAPASKFVAVPTMATSTRMALVTGTAPPRMNTLNPPLSASISLQKHPFSSSFHLKRSGSVHASAAIEVQSKAADASSELKGTSIFLVGLKSAIKTKLGNALADALRYYYFDTDSLVEQAAGGEAAAKSLRESDMQGYSDSETEVLRQLSSMGRLVVCTGDGALQSSTNLALLRHGITIWIEIPVNLLAKDDPEVLAKLTAQNEKMREGYAIADATVSLQKVASQLGYDDMDAVTIEDMAVQALEEIEKLTRVKKMMEAAARPF